nr:PQQ-dependent sugar dehydrogenase [Nocardioides convexus]
MAYAGGYLWMAALRGERLWRIKVAGGQVSDPTAYFTGGEGDEGYGRLRTVVAAPDGRLWLTTSNKDGRGTVGADDDQILLIDP